MSTYKRRSHPQYFPDHGSQFATCVQQAPAPLHCKHSQRQIAPLGIFCGLHGGEKKQGMQNRYSETASSRVRSEPRAAVLQNSVISSKPLSQDFHPELNQNSSFLPSLYRSLKTMEPRELREGFEPRMSCSRNLDPKGPIHMEGRGSPELRVDRFHERPRQPERSHL